MRHDRPAHPRPTRAPSYAMLSTFPPTPCGVATFADALATGLATHGVDVGIVRIGGTAATDDRRVVARLDDRSPTPAPSAIEALDAADVAIVQHEYGLYAGDDGASVLDVLEAVQVPTIVVAHTVLGDPSPGQRQVLEGVARAADAVVVMTEAGRLRLADAYDVDLRKVSVIAHGAAVVDRCRPELHRSGSGLLTWGLLGPGKGIEWAIDAVAQLRDLRPEVRYCVAGATHPKVRARDGEAYRELLRSRARAAGISKFVRFDAAYRDLTALAALIERCEVVVLPYDSPDQVTSGVLVDAIAAGRPVIATAFPHAVELLASGAGIVVPRQDPDALADAIRSVLTEPGVHEAMAAEARRLAPGLAWPTIASHYVAVGDHVRTHPEPAVA